MSALPDDAAWAFGSGWVRLVTDQLEQHTRLLGDIDARVKRTEDISAENSRKLTAIDIKIDEILRRLENPDARP